MMLLSFVAVLVLSIGLFAVAKPGGGSADAALGAAMGQVGKPYSWGTEGPGTFSCVGLVRYALRSAGVDDAAPWDHMAYLSVYPTVSEPAPGDVVVYPDGAAMYVGDGQIVMANEVDQVVGTYGMNEVGTPVGFARPYGGAVDPAAGDQGLVDPLVGDQGLVDPLVGDQGFVDPLVGDQGLVDPLVGDEGLVDPVVGDQGLVDPLVGDQGLVDPLVGDQGLVPAAVDQYMMP